MKSVKDIKNYIDSKQSNPQNYYQITKDSSIQVYKSTPRQAVILLKNHPILKIEERSRNGLSFFLPEEVEEDIINYGKGCHLNDDESIIKIFNTFENHKSIEEVLANLLLLNSNLDY